ncbi:MAG: superoxide dismutase, partial [Kibdelosporangium sp.]
MRSLAVVATVVVIALSTVVAGAAAATAAPASVAITVAAGVTKPYEPGADAITYRPDLVPAGAKLSVFGISRTRWTKVLLAVHGLVANRQYGAHVHVQPCGAAPADAGPHFQHREDPVQPSVDPAYANPANEIWLDLTTDANGDAVTFTHVEWSFGGRRAGSVVLHETHTHTGPGQAGTAGA